MSTKEVAAISLKVLAIWLLVHMVFKLPQLSFLAVELQHSFGLETYPYNVFIGMIVTTVFFGSLACYLLFRISNSVLCSLNSDMEKDRSDLSQEFILQVAGVFFLVSALVVLPESIRSLYHAYLATQEFPTTHFAPMAFFLGVVIKLMVGVGMIVGAKKCRAVLNKLRGRV